MKLPLLGAMGVAILYGDLVGWPASATRAVIMIVVASFGKLLDLDISLWNLLGIAAMLILFREPADIHDLGFQLSFSAVAGILWTAPIFQKLVDAKKRPVLHRWIISIGVTIGAMLGTLPLCGWVFQTLPLISPLSNFLISPLMGTVAVPCAIFAYATQGWVANLFLCFGDAAIELSLLILRVFETDPAMISFSMIEIGWTVIVLLLIRWNILSALLMIPLFWKIESQPSHLEIQFLPIGQGDAALIRWPDGDDWLIDAGPFSFELVPYLRREGISEIELMVLSHPHKDHFGALMPVLEHIQVEQFLTLRSPEKGEAEYQRLWQRLQEKNVEIVLSEQFQSERGKLWHPLNGWSSTTNRINEESLVLELFFGQHRFLFTGDIERRAEQHLLGKIGDIDVLKVPHHGSKSSSSVEWLTELQPEVSVISCGAGNPFGHPHAQTLFALKDTHHFRTDEDGMVVVSSDGVQLQVTAGQNQNRRVLELDKPLLLR